MTEKLEETLSVIGSMAQRFGMERAAFEKVVIDQCMPKGRPGDPDWTMTEFVAFLMVCREHNLNPITREIYAMKKKGGGLIPVVSVDGWIRKINEHGQFDGMSFKEEHNAKGELVSTTCEIFRRDRNHPIAVTEYLNECVRDTEPWKMRHRMLRHKSLIQCARIAFGFAGIYDEDEAERFAERQQMEAKRVPPPPPPEEAEKPKEARKPPEPPQVTDERQVRSTIPYGATPAEVEAIVRQDTARHVREAAIDASYVDLADTAVGQDFVDHESLLDDYHADLEASTPDSLGAVQALYAPKLNKLPQEFRVRAEGIYEKHANRVGA